MQGRTAGRGTIRRGLIVGSVVMTIGLAGLTPAEAAPRATTTTLAAPVALVYGQGETLSVRVIDRVSHAAQRNVLVVFEARGASASTFSKFAQVRTDVHGVARRAYTPRTSTLFRARVVADTAHTASTSAARRTSVRYRIDATANPTIVDPGGSSTITGRVQPPRPGASVRLLRALAGGTTTAAVTTQTADGSFAMTLTPPDSTRAPYSVVVDATSALSAGSRAVEIRVRRPVVVQGNETGRVTLAHPAWGPLTVITSETPASGSNPFVAHLLVVDDAGDTRLQRDWQWGNGMLKLNSPATDNTQNVFLRYNPGRYDGVIVLRGVPSGIEDFGSLPANDSYQGPGPFGYDTETRDDKPQDGQLEIIQFENECVPDCASEGSHAERRFQWDGRTYRQEPIPVSCEADLELLRACQFALAVQSGNLAGLSASEREVAARTTNLPARKFRGRQCELQGDITARCVITFALSPGAFQTTSAAFDVQPANCTYSNGACTYPPGEQPRYEVVGYEGLG